MQDAMWSSPVLAVHFGAGLLSLSSAVAAMAFRKGHRRHRVAGRVFVLSMLILSGSGAYVGFVKDQELNGLQGVITFYLVGTAWLTARRRDWKAGIVDFGAAVVPLAVATGLVIHGVAAARSQTGSMDGYPPAAYFIFAAVALLFAAGDVRMLVRGGISGVQRVTRHFLRMCYAVFTASASFFLGQAQVFPEAVRVPALLAIPAILPLLVMLYWLWRIRVRRNHRAIGVAVPAQAPRNGERRARRSG